MAKAKKKRRWPFFALILLLCLGALLSPLSPFTRSLAVMGVYSGLHEGMSLLEEEGIELDIPGGLQTQRADWYPRVITYVADESYARYTGEEGARLTILYNFPAFDYSRGCSRLFDETSPYYNGFYGAYLLRDSSNASLAAGELDEEAAAQVAAFDYFKLVLGDFGLAKEDQVFDFTVTERSAGVYYAGYEGWTRLRTSITVNGAAHNKQGWVQSYLQYGAPNFGHVEQPFAPVTLSGVVYGRYFPEWDLGIYFYIMGSEEALLACDEEILSFSTLGAKDGPPSPGRVLVPAEGVDNLH